MATVYNRGGSYYISYFDQTGKRRTKSARTTDKATADRIAKDIEAKVALRREGVIDATVEAMNIESQRTLEEHLADYESKLRAAQRTEKHIKSTLKFIRWIATFAGFTKVCDINADAVNRYAAKLKTDDGLSARTIQYRKFHNNTRNHTQKRVCALPENGGGLKWGSSK